MLYVNQNDQNILIYSESDIADYVRVAGDPRLDPESVCLDLGHGLFCRSNLTRKDLYQFMGYKTFDYAFPQPWADSPEGQKLFIEKGRKSDITDPETGEVTGKRPWRRGDRYPALVWCYDAPEGSDRDYSIFGYPVFDCDVLAKMGRKIREMILSQDPAIEHVKSPWKDPEFDADLAAETV